MTKKSFTLEELASLLNIKYAGNKKHILTGVNDLANAKQTDVSFLTNIKYRRQLKITDAGVVCVDKTTLLEEGKNYIISDTPSEDFEKICRLLLEDHSESGFKKIHPTACIHHTAKIGNNILIGPYVVIDRDVRIGSDTIIHAHVSVGSKTTIGNNCTIHANVVIRENCHIKNRVILQPSCVIGSCGYGYNSSKKTGSHTKIKHLGSVVIEDDVEIGSSTTVDRGRFNATTIGKGTKIDNQCMVGHNCQIGENNLIVSMSGISGSVKTGKNVVIAAQCGVVGHIEIADGVTLAARSAPSKSILEPNGTYLGAPAQNIKKEVAEIIALRRLPEIIKKIKKAEKLFSIPEEEEESK